MKFQFQNEIQNNLQYIVGVQYYLYLQIFSSSKPCFQGRHPAAQEHLELRDVHTITPQSHTPHQVIALTKSPVWAPKRKVNFFPHGLSYFTFPRDSGFQKMKATSSSDVIPTSRTSPLSPLTQVPYWYLGSLTMTPGVLQCSGINLSKQAKLKLLETSLLKSHASPTPPPNSRS